MDVVTRLIAYLLGYQGISFVFMVLLLALGGIPNNLKSIASTALWCDSLDYIELKTGKRAEAVTFAAQNFIEKARSGLSTFMAGTLRLLNSTPLNTSRFAIDATFNKWIWFVFVNGACMAAAVLYSFNVRQIFG